MIALKKHTAQNQLFYFFSYFFCIAHQETFWLVTLMFTRRQNQSAVLHWHVDKLKWQVLRRKQTNFKQLFLLDLEQDLSNKCKALRIEELKCNEFENSVVISFYIYLPIYLYLPTYLSIYIIPSATKCFNQCFPAFLGCSSLKTIHNVHRPVFLDWSQRPALIMWKTMKAYQKINITCLLWNHPFINADHSISVPALKTFQALMQL